MRCYPCNPEHPYAHTRSQGDESGFRRSRRPMGGRHHILLALQKPGHKGLFNVCRPNTGDGFFDLEKIELDSKYQRVDPEAVREEWSAAFEGALTVCMHGPNCRDGAACQVGQALPRMAGAAC